MRQAEDGGRFLPRHPLSGGMSEEVSRVTALEELAAHQGRVIEELSAQITEQWKAMDQMRRKLDHLTERLLDIEEQALEAPPVTRPPHY